jgi:DNA-binding IclR family transcriptional regulator
MKASPQRDALVKYLGDFPNGLPAAQIAKALKLSQKGVYRITAKAISLGLLRKHGGYYFPGGPRYAKPAKVLNSDSALRRYKEFCTRVGISLEDGLDFGLKLLAEKAGRALRQC